VESRDTESQRSAITPSFARILWNVRVDDGLSICITDTFDLSLRTATGTASRYNGGNGGGGQNGGSIPPSRKNHPSAANADVEDSATMEIDQVELSNFAESTHNPNEKSAADSAPDETGEQIASNNKDIGKPASLRKDKGKQKLKSTSMSYRVVL